MPNNSIERNQVIKNCLLQAVFLFDTNYRAGACLPLPPPSGCFGQLFAVKDEIDENFCPQCLQVY
jgi:hypothetical protein